MSYYNQIFSTLKNKKMNSIETSEYSATSSFLPGTERAIPQFGGASNDLFELASASDFQSIAQLIKQGANITALDANSNTILHILASKSPNSSVNQAIDALLTSPNIRLIVNKQNSNGDTPAHVALRANNSALVDKLVQIGANQKIKNNAGQYIISDSEPVDAGMVGGYSATSSFAPGHKQSGGKNFRRVEYSATSSFAPGYIQRGAGSNLFNLANESKYQELAQLIKSGADITGVDSNSNTILHIIASKQSNGPINIVTDALLGRPDIKLIINKQNVSGNTALHSALRANNMFLVEQLIKLGADKSIKNLGGEFIAETETSPGPMAGGFSRNSESSVFASKKGKTTARSATIDRTENYVEDASRIFEALNRAELKKWENYEYTQDFPTTLAMSEATTGIPQVKRQTQLGGNIKSETSELFNTEQFMNEIINSRPSRKTNMAMGSMKGGSNKRIVVSGSRSINSYNATNSLFGGSEYSDYEMSRDNPANEIHERVIQKIMDLMGVPREVARNYKAAIYRTISEANPEMKGYDKAVKMEEMTTKKVLDKIDIEKVTREIEQHLKEKAESQPSKPEKTKSAKSTKSDKPAKKSTKKSKAAESESDSESDSETGGLSRQTQNQVTMIHERVIEKIMKLMDVPREVAVNYRAVIYKRVKDANPELSGYDRAIEMEKLANKETLSEIDIKKVTKEIAKHIEEKAQAKLTTTTSDMSTSSISSSTDEKPKKTRKSTKKETELSSTTSPFEF